MLTSEQIKFVKECIRTWSYALKNGQFTSADVDHSSYLDRLLRGKDVLEYAPPRSYSYPWVRLIVHKFQENCEFYTLPHDSKRSVLDQAFWNIVEKISDEEYILEWPEQSSGYFKNRPEPWRVRVTRQKEYKHEFFQWRVDLLN